MDQISYEVVRTENDFKREINQLLTLASQSRVELAMDTEFTSTDTYFPIPRLLQFAYATRTVIVDLKFVKLSSTNESGQLFTGILHHSNIEKIFHCAKPDCEIFRQVFGAIPSSPIFDTQIAAKACGYLRSQVSLKDLVLNELKLELAKTEQRSDWTKPNLTTDQLDYAARDVIFLLRVYPILVDKLGERRAWLKEEFDKLSDPQQYEQDASRLWEKLNFPPTLNLRGRFALQQMAILRDSEARRLNKPRGRIFPDSDLFTLAKNLPNTEESASRLLKRKFPYSQLDYNMSKVCIEAQTVDQALLNQLQNEEKPDVPESLIHLVDEIVKIVSRQLGVADSLVGGRKEFIEFVDSVLRQRDISQLPLGSGWKFKWFGSVIVDFIAGKSAVKWTEGQLQIFAIPN